MLLFCSCYATHSGSISSNAIINENTKTIGRAYGNARATYFLGIEGLNKESLLVSAQNDISAAYPLKSNCQHYANFVNSSSTFSFFCILIEHSLSLQADIIEYANCIQDTTSKFVIGDIVKFKYTEIVYVFGGSDTNHIDKQGSVSKVHRYSLEIKVLNKDKFVLRRFSEVNLFKTKANLKKSYLSL
jgi:hypothetical protein